MLTVIESMNENWAAQKRLAKAFEAVAEKTEELNIGWQGGSTWTAISWSNELQLRWSFLDDRDNTPRYWRAFSTKEPHWGTTHSHIIQCEINSPFRGSSRQVAAAFAKDDAGHLFLIHRGNIGGGKKGIGKSLFFDRTQSKKITIRDAQGETVAVLVGALDSKRFCHQVAEFVHDVARIKDLAVKQEIQVKKQYGQEYAGEKRYDITKRVVAECDHGLVVDAMRQELEKRGLIVANDQFRDLYILSEKNKTIQGLFEFKTDNSRSSMYSAIGQLMFNALSVNQTLVAVLPEPITPKAKARLKELKINCVTYAWKNNRPQFKGLSSLFDN
ncbi:MAG: hypothetical protein HDKAJFGB_02951 [Anaerolineae bacterium]|nr:hypothetical protein [Anaerolineae bacterium]